MSKPSYILSYLLGIAGSAWGIVTLALRLLFNRRELQIEDARNIRELSRAARQELSRVHADYLEMKAHAEQCDQRHAECERKYADLSATVLENKSKHEAMQIEITALRQVCQTITDQKEVMNGLKAITDEMKIYSHAATHRLAEPLHASNLKLALLLKQAHVPENTIREAEAEAKRLAAEPTIIEQI